MLIPAGAQFIISDGYHEAYMQHGMYEALKGISEEAIARVYATAEVKGPRLKIDQAIKALIAEGYIQHIACKELFLGDYRKLNVEYTDL